MWDPNETLASWARDDDVLSWRSLDTLRGVETDRFLHDNAAENAESDVSDLEELAEVIDKRTARTGAVKDEPSFEGSGGKHDMAASVSLSDTIRSQTTQRRCDAWASLDDHPIQQHHRLHDNGSLYELPSTSEMVSIREPTPVALRIPFVGRARDAADRPENGNRMNDEDRTMYDANASIRRMAADPQQRPAVESDSRRAPMTLGDLLAKRITDTEQPPPIPPSPPSSMLSALPAPVVVSEPVNASARLQEMKTLERRCDDLAEKERHLQVVLAKQLHQIETMSDQLRQYDTKFQSQQLELSGLKEQVSRLERQNATLQTSLREKEHAQEQQTQLLVQKTNELTALESKVRTMQITNETFQEQARKATDEKDKVHKDYLQVVYDLGKLQKQMNAASKETVNIAEKDLLLREIDQLRHEKDQLSTRLKESEARKSSLLQNNAAVEAQRLRELQNRVREREEDLSRARNGRATPSMPAQQSFLSRSLAPSISQPPSRLLPQYDSYQPVPQQEFLRSASAPMPCAPAWAQYEQQSVPSLLNSLPSGSGGPKPMTLKDMMVDRRPQASSSSSSLASLGYSMADRRASGSTGNALDVEQLQADALMRQSTSIGDMLRQQSTSHVRISDPPNAAISAPFATEKQTLLQDSLQKRDLEQKLLKLHVEKEQTEAKLVKVEQTGLKTMSARTEKTWLESRLRDLTLEISRLKLSLR